MLRLSLDLITFPLYPRIILETRLRFLTFKVMMWPTKLTSPSCMFSLWRIWQNQVTKWNFEVHLNFTLISARRIRGGGGGGGVNVSVLTRGFLCDVCLFVYKGISFSGGDTNFYLFLQINWHWQIQISLTKEKYNYCSCLVIIIGETPRGAGAGAVAEA